MENKMSKWIESFKVIANQHEFCILNPPATLLLGLLIVLKLRNRES